MEIRVKVQLVEPVSDGSDVWHEVVEEDWLYFEHDEPDLLLEVEDLLDSYIEIADNLEGFER